MSWTDDCKKKALALPKEKRQEFLDAMHRGGSIKENYEKLNLSFDEANGIMMLNISIVSHTFLNKDTI